MKIVICASMSASQKVIEIKEKLEKAGHRIIIPSRTEQYANGTLPQESRRESVANKVHGDLLRKYFNEIKESDAILAVNFDKDGIENYIGGNTFLEMGFAHVLGKKLFLLNNISNISYRDEIVAMQPIILNGNLNNIG